MGEDVENDIRRLFCWAWSSHGNQRPTLQREEALQQRSACHYSYNVAFLMQTCPKRKAGDKRTRRCPLHWVVLGCWAACHLCFSSCFCSVLVGGVGRVRNQSPLGFGLPPLPVRPSSALSGRGLLPSPTALSHFLFPDGWGGGGGLGSAAADAGCGPASRRGAELMDVLRRWKTLQRRR